MKSGMQRLYKLPYEPDLGFLFCKKGGDVSISCFTAGTNALRRPFECQLFFSPANISELPSVFDVGGLILTPGNNILPSTHKVNRCFHEFHQNGRIEFKYLPMVKSDEIFAVLRESCISNTES